MQKRILLSLQMANIEPELDPEGGNLTIGNWYISDLEESPQKVVQVRGFDISNHVLLKDEQYNDESAQLNPMAAEEIVSPQARNDTRLFNIPYLTKPYFRYFGNWYRHPIYTNRIGKLVLRHGQPALKMLNGYEIEIQAHELPERQPPPMPEKTTEQIAAMALQYAMRYVALVIIYKVARQTVFTDESERSDYARSEIVKLHDLFYNLLQLGVDINLLPQQWHDYNANGIYDALNIPLIWSDNPYNGIRMAKEWANGIMRIQQGVLEPDIEEEEHKKRIKQDWYYKNRTWPEFFHSFSKGTRKRSSRKRSSRKRTSHKRTSRK